MIKKLAISFLIGLILSAGAIYFSFKHVPLAELSQYLVSIDYRWAVPSLGLVVLTLILRAFRWRFILAPGNPITVAQAFNPMMIGFMINCVLPGRLGELARPMALRQTSGVAFGTGLATVAAERFFDLFLAAALFLIMMNIVQIDPDASIPFGDYELNRDLLESLFSKTMAVGCVLLCGLVMISARPTRRLLVTIISSPPRLLTSIAPRLSEMTAKYFSRPLAALVETVASGLDLLRSLQKMLVCLVLTAMVWGVQLLSIVVLARGFPGIDLTVLEMGAMMIIILFFIALPSVPGWWGIWEAGGIFAMGLFGVPRLEAAGFTLVNHATQVFPVILIGIGCAMISSIGILQVTRTAVVPDQRPPV